MKNKPFLQPLTLFNDPVLLSGNSPESLPQNIECVADLSTAMQLENAQTLPKGYAIWSDALADAVAPFYCTPAGHEGREIIAAKAEEIWDSMGNFERELYKKRLRKTITEWEEFWLTVAYDILEILQSVALARYVGGGSQSQFLEDVYTVFQAGFYPCGLKKDGSIVAFDPRRLDRG